MARKRNIDAGAGGLNEREELILRYIVQNYILTADPVGSRYLSKRLEEESISPATIRNTMADLEEKGFISHPHTSAGRVPTDFGYRFYVDMLMKGERLSDHERSTIRRNIDPSQSTPLLMKEASRLIAVVSNQLGFVTAPEILDGVLERIELVPLSSTRLLVVLSLQANLIKTVTLEVHQEYVRDRLAGLVGMLNERLAGLTLRVIRATVRERFSDVASSPEGEELMNLLLEKSHAIFTEPAEFERVQISPSYKILNQPEFANPEQVRGIVELIENEEMVIHLLDKRPGEHQGLEIVIGSEHTDQRMADYSLITTRYRVGSTTGAIGLIGPKRMNYSKMVSLLEYIAKTITHNFEGL
jgi:heat-inducible transcriptional repressor